MIRSMGARAHRIVALSALASGMLFFSSACGLFVDHGCHYNAHFDGESCVCDSGYGGDPYDFCGLEVEQVWNIVDGCDDGRDIQFRLFSEDGEPAWPGWNTSFETSGFDVVDPVAITCFEGETICFGAESSLKAWGCGLEGVSGSCGASCYECLPGDLPEELLTCD